MTKHALDYRRPPPTLAEIEAIIAMADPALRNLRITQTYHELAVALAEQMGETNVTWCAYATWASKTAGVFIRGDNVEAVIRRYLDTSEAVIEDVDRLKDVLRRLGQETNLDRLLLVLVLETVTEGITRDIGDGNLLVFAELAPLYRQFLDLLVTSETFDQAALDELLGHLQPSEVVTNGQDRLAQAFTLIYQARFELDPQAKAELIFFANTMAGYHEQARLQGAIAGAMQAPLTEDVELVLSQRLDDWTRIHVLRPVGMLVRLIWRRRVRTLAVQLADDWRRISTELLMTMDLPSETLHLGRDLPLGPNGRMFPPDLAVIENAELSAVLDALDRTSNSSAGSGAHDWGNLDDRMNFIADFFRSRQQDHTLYAQPFSVQQIEIMLDGEIPDGHL